MSAETFKDAVRILKYRNPSPIAVVTFFKNAATGETAVGKTKALWETGG
jgi:hypothetical protein